MPAPAQPKLYHILHRDKLPFIVRDGCLFADAAMAGRSGCGTTIGMNTIKQRRLTELQLGSHPGLYVGQCVPFYFCPRSVMLYLIYQGNRQELTYRGGQEPIVHLELDLHAVVQWATGSGRRWAFSLSNAGSYHFIDHSDLARLDEVDWEAVDARRWSGQSVPRPMSEGKQAEFLVEEQVPWHLVERIGVRSSTSAQLVADSIAGAAHRPQINTLPDWYY